MGLAPLIVIEPLTEFLDTCGLGSGPIGVVRIGEGHSNATFAIIRGRHRWVLRRGPRPPYPRATHDMLREARIVVALRAAGVPVPEVVAVCEDTAVLGVPFYLMEYVYGHILTNSLPAAMRSFKARSAIGVAATKALADLHQIDVTTGELSGLSKHDGYLERQLSRFIGLWESQHARHLPTVERLHEWLVANRPAMTRLAMVHGDFRLGNLMFANGAPPRVLTILDWEMSTLGDPLADLGYFIATFSDMSSVRTVMDLSPVTGLPGFQQRSDLATLYGQATGLDLRPLPWYQVLALWKSAIFCEEIFNRWRLGGSPPGNEFAARLEVGIPTMLTEAARIAAISTPLTTGMVRKW